MLVLLRLSLLKAYRISNFLIEIKLLPRQVNLLDDAFNKVTLGQ